MTLVIQRKRTPDPRQETLEIKDQDEVTVVLEKRKSMRVLVAMNLANHSFLMEIKLTKAKVKTILKKWTLKKL